MICVSYFEALERHSKFVSPSGDGFVDVYELKLNKDYGNEELVKTGKKSLFDEIQAYKESTEIHNIIERYVNGEVDLIKQVDGFYGDVTNAPKSYAEFFNKVKEAKEIFNNLPDDIRAKYDNDPEKFFNKFGNESIVNDIDKVNEDIKVESEDVDNAK